jgi:hypothetical protein
MAPIKKTASTPWIINKAVIIERALPILPLPSRQGPLYLTRSSALSDTIRFVCGHAAPSRIDMRGMMQQPEPQWQCGTGDLCD